ncbi:MAG: hypothetical protein WBC33_11825 [Conexibacter sp.]
MSSRTAQRPLPRRAPRLSAALAKPLTWPPALVLVGLLLGVVAATNRWMSWGAGFHYARADDERAYLAIANAFPHLPAERIADQHAQRWPIHWLIGGVADLLGAKPEIVYRYAAILLALAVCLTLAAVLMRLRTSTATALLCLATFALNPYALRYYGLAPGYLDDLGLELGIAVTLLGLVARRLPLVLAGLLAGVLCRQTMLPVVPVVALWVALAPDWRAASGSVRIGRAVAVLMLPIGAYLAIKGAAADFSRPGIPFSRLTIVDAVTGLPDTASDLVNHFAHVAIALLVIAALLAATLVRTELRDLPSAFWGSLAIGLVVVAQAAALNPDPVFNDYSSSNEPRLTAMSLGALVVTLAAARRATAPALALLALALLTIGTFHQDLTVLSTGSAGVTLALQAAVAGALAVAVWLSDRRPASRRPA